MLNLASGQAKVSSPADSFGVLSLGGAHALLRRPLVHDAAGIAPVVTLSLIPGASCSLRLVATGRWPAGDSTDSPSSLPALASAEWVIQNLGGGGPDSLVALLMKSSSTVGSNNAGLRWDSSARVHAHPPAGASFATAGPGALSVTLEVNTSAGALQLRAGSSGIVAFAVVTIEGEFDIVS